MGNNLIVWLNSVFNLLDNKRNRYLLIIIVMISGVLFVNVFKPWNIGRWHSDDGIIKFMRLSSYGVIVSFVLLLTQFPLRKVLKKKTLKVKEYILLLCFEILLISLVYIFLYGNPVGNFINDFLFSLKYTFLGILIPYSMALFVIYYLQQKEKINELKEQTLKPTFKVTDLIAIKDEKGKVKFSIQYKNILYLESTDNYFTIFHFSDEGIKRDMVRNSLKNAANLLKEYSIIRCHRSYMVNLYNIDLVKKQGKKFFIKIKTVDELIPISDMYKPLFNEYLS